MEGHKEVLKKFADYLNKKSLFDDGLRKIGYELLKGARSLADGMQNIFKDVLGINKFYNSPSVTKLFNSLKPLVIILFTLSIVYLGFLLITNKKEDRSNIIMNIILSITLIIMLPYIMNQLSTVVTQSISAIDNIEEEDIQPVDKVYKGLFVDVQKLNDDGLESKPTTETAIHEGVTVDDLKRLEVNAIVENPIDPLTYYLNGDYVLEMPKNGFLTILEDGYYRWDISFFKGYVYFFTMIIVYGLSSLKLARILFELGVNKIFGLLVVGADLHSGQRTKAVFKEIFSSYLTIIAMYLMLIMYSYFTAFLNLQDELGFIATSILLIGSGFAVIDGAKIFEKILGIDSGLENAQRTMMSTYYGGRMLVGGIKSAGSTMSGAMESINNRFGGSKNTIDFNEGGFVSGEGTNTVDDNLNVSAGGDSSQDGTSDSEINDVEINSHENQDVNLNKNDRQGDNADTNLINESNTPDETGGLGETNTSTSNDNLNPNDLISEMTNGYQAQRDYGDSSDIGNLGMGSLSQSEASESANKYMDNLNGGLDYKLNNSTIDENNILTNNYQHKDISGEGKEISIDLATGVGKEYNTIQSNKYSPVKKELVNEFNISDREEG